MHTEHLQNVRTGRVLMAWLIAASVTSLAAFAFIAAGRMTGAQLGRGHLAGRVVTNATPRSTHSRRPPSSAMPAASM